MSSDWFITTEYEGHGRSKKSLDFGLRLDNLKSQCHECSLSSCDQLRSFLCEVKAEDQYDEGPHDWPACTDQVILHPA